MSKASGDKPPYFKPRISDEEPKVPEGWGLAIFRGKVQDFFCDACGKRITVRDQYLYRHADAVTPLQLLHNTKECCARLIS